MHKKKRKNIVTLKKNENIKKVKVGISWTFMFFGFFVSVFRKDWIIAILGFTGSIIGSAVFFPAVTLFQVGFSFIYNRIYIKKLLKNGWIPAEEEDEKILAEKNIIFHKKGDSYRSSHLYYVENKNVFSDSELDRKEDTIFENTEKSGLITYSSEDGSRYYNYGKKENLYSHRLKQKMFARTIGGGAVVLLTGIFFMNFLLMLLGGVFVGLGILMGIKYKDEIKWK